MNDEPIEGELVQESALDAVTRVEIDMAISTAKRYPRSISKFVADVRSMATIDEETAAGCFYSLRRSNKTIKGPSVRLAEIAVSAFGNIRAGSRIMGETPDGKFIKAQGVCHDLEKNVYVSMDSQRRITDKNGRKYKDDMIAVTANAAAAVGFRNAVFKVIPKSLIESAYKECIRIATGDAKTLTEKRESIFAKLMDLNPLITKEKILRNIGKRKIKDVDLEDVAHLIGVGTAIRDGVSKIDDEFPPESSSVKDILGDEKKNTKKSRKVATEEPTLITPERMQEIFQLAENSPIGEEGIKEFIFEKFDVDKITKADEALILAEIERVK